MPDARMAVQLYTLRESGLDFEATLAAVAEAGYDGVETVGSHALSAADLRASLARHGLQACSAHVGLARLLDDVDGTSAFYREAGIDTLVVPFLPSADRPETAQGWAALGERLGALAARCRERGTSLLYHNHDFEFAEVEGEPALTHLLRAGEPLGLELDLGWAVRAGADPHAWLSRHAGRVTRVHVKDLAEGGGEAEGGWADVGHGTIAWPPLLRAARAAGADWWIVEHDRPRDPLASIRRSADHLRQVRAQR